MKNVNVVFFQIEAEDIGPLLKVRVGHDGKGMFAGWFLDKVDPITLQCSDTLAPAWHVCHEGALSAHNYFTGSYFRS